MYQIIRAKHRKPVLIQKKRQLTCGEEIAYLTFPQLSQIECIEHLFTTRLGGVSRGDCATLNFSFSRGDEEAAVQENYRRIAELFGTDSSHFVTTDQTHTTNIRIVTKEDEGKGVTVPRDYTDIDGLITKERGLILSCFTADCVPLYFVDPVKKVIGVAHSGWRGTVAGIGAEMVSQMQKVFECNPEDIQTAVGPSICQNCYEISEEVAERFREGFWAEEKVEKFSKEACEKGLHPTGELLMDGRTTGKYQLDLWLANYVVLRCAGILPEHISMTDICTNCNPDYLFSHRASKGKRGNLAAFLMLK